jgi:hypothetical protein
MVPFSREPLREIFLAGNFLEKLGPGLIREIFLAGNFLEKLGPGLIEEIFSQSHQQYVG